ncbi:hypothetical protein [Nocardiopsis metallicus]|uniref:Transferase n=1 Tax=Nocardiopsis metallicus TaxID=179819 RepID=A0A840W725_9ACTN|nr:hypothetical protein [Nocardiopsis metallicus]MBB5492809.1 hypothetical protein [Nocardiopsis metallicus]
MAGTVARATARMLGRRHVTRSGVTRISVLLAVAAAVWFSRADLVGALAGSALLGLVLFCDAVRSRMRANRRDALTVWTASIAAQLREYAVYVGLAFGAAAAGFTSAWGWAAGALIALALRDALLVARSAPAAASGGSGAKPPALPAQRRAEGFRVPPPRPGSTGSAAATAAPSLASPVAPEADGGLSPVLLARRVMVFGQPIRFLVIAVATVAVDARIAFLSLIVGCAVAITGELVDPSSRGGRR